MCIGLDSAGFLTLSKNLLSFTAFEVPAARYRGLVQSWEQTENHLSHAPWTFFYSITPYALVINNELKTRGSTGSFQLAQLQTLLLEDSMNLKAVYRRSTLIIPPGVARVTIFICA